MKRHTIAILSFALMVNGVEAQISNSNRPPGMGTKPVPINQPKTDFSKIFKNDKEKNSYAIGLQVGSGLKSQLLRGEVDYDLDAMVKALRDGLSSNSTPLITEAQEREIIADLRTQMNVKMEEKRKLQAEEMRIKGEKNKAEGEAFLARNKNVPGVITLTNGLQYQVLTPGAGESPKAEDEVNVNYRGTLIDNTEFDSSYSRGKPLTARVKGGIIPGWTEALLRMKPGAKWRVFIPPDLAYGARGSGQKIPPNSTLIFEMELVSIKPAAPAAPATSSAAPAPAPVNTTPLTSDIIRVPSQEEMAKGKKIETIKAEDVGKAATNQ